MQVLDGMQYLKTFIFNSMENPRLLYKSRGDIHESYHRGTICIVDKDNHVLFEKGNIHEATFTRSALKLFQTIPLIESGAADFYNLSDQEIAVTCGSHNAEKIHQDLVNSILQKIGSNVSELQCGAQPPSHRATRNNIVQNKQNFSAIHNNCSGKHAGFIALAKYLGDDSSKYLSPESKCQQLIKKTVAEVHQIDEKELIDGEDGCSAPNYAMSVKQQAIGYKNLAHPIILSEKRQKAIKRITQAISNFPYLIAGEKRYCTELTSIYKNELIGKTGADGIFSMLFLDKKWGCTIKVEDGSMGPQYVIAQNILEALKIGTISQRERLKNYLAQPIKNWNKHQTGFLAPFTDEFNALKKINS